MPNIAFDEVLARTAKIAHAVTAAEAEAVDTHARWPEATFRALQSVGLAGLVVPAEFGGLGHGLLAVARVCEVLGTECASTAISFGMHLVGSAVIAAKATAEQADTYLRPIAAGRHITTLALSEPGTGVNFYYPETTLERTEEHYRVNGTKSFITNGGHADSYVVSTVAADPNAPPAFFSCVLIPKGVPGLSWQEPYQGFGMRGNSARTAILEDIRVPDSDLLGNEGDQIWYVFHVVAPYFLVAMSGTYLGIADHTIRECIAHLRGRAYAHHGRALAHEPVLQHRLGQLWAQVERTRRLVYWAAEEADRGGPKALPGLCSAKAEVADCAVHVVNEAMTLLGGATYRDGTILPRLLRDARAGHVMAPTTDILRTWTGRALLDIPLLAE